MSHIEIICLCGMKTNNINNAEGYFEKHLKHLILSKVDIEFYIVKYINSSHFMYFILF